MQVDWEQQKPEAGCAISTSLCIVLGCLMSHHLLKHLIQLQAGSVCLIQHQVHCSVLVPVCPLSCGRAQPCTDM